MLFVVFIMLLVNVVECMQGGAKVQEAKYIYQELGDKYNFTASPIQDFRLCESALSLAGWLHAGLPLQRKGRLLHERG